MGEQNTWKNSKNKKNWKNAEPQGQAECGRGPRQNSKNKKNWKNRQDQLEWAECRGAD
jgi:hypothetical protein